jgi:ubiquinone biosynthesis monooxygenase Coq7
MQNLSEKQRLEQLIRVNQAGEYGAKRIYRGQLAVLGKTDMAPILQHMEAQEQEHLDTFNKLIVEHRVRPTVLNPLWHVAGFALGAGTALLGKKAAMACTIAVEEVIEEHYAEQISDLEKNDPTSPLIPTLKKFRAEEMEHKDTAEAEEGKKAPFYPLLRQVIRTGSKTAIFLAKRV